MEKMNTILQSMTFEFFGGGNHKITSAQLISGENNLMLDVRSTEEMETVSFPLEHHIPTLHIPIDEIPERIAEIPKDKLVGVFCASGTRSAIVYAYLQAAGYTNTRITEGGYAELAAELKPGKLLKQLKQA